MEVGILLLLVAVVTVLLSKSAKGTKTATGKFCPNCGTQLEADSAFCTNCGAKQ